MRLKEGLDKGDGIRDGFKTYLKSKMHGLAIWWDLSHQGEGKIKGDP